MKDINYYIRCLYNSNAELSDVIGILQELLARIEALEEQMKGTP